MIKGTKGNNSLYLKLHSCVGFQKYQSAIHTNDGRTKEMRIEFVLPKSIWTAQ